MCTSQVEPPMSTPLKRERPSTPTMEYAGPTRVSTTSLSEVEYRSPSPAAKKSRLLGTRFVLAEHNPQGDEDTGSRAEGQCVIGQIPQSVQLQSVQPAPEELPHLVVPPYTVIDDFANIEYSASDLKVEGSTIDTSTFELRISALPYQGLDSAMNVARMYLREINNYVKTMDAAGQAIYRMLVKGDEGWIDPDLYELRPGVPDYMYTDGKFTFHPRYYPSSVILVVSGEGKLVLTSKYEGMKGVKTRLEDRGVEVFWSCGRVTDRRLMGTFTFHLTSGPDTITTEEISSWVRGTLAKEEIAYRHQHGGDLTYTKTHRRDHTRDVWFPSVVRMMRFADTNPSWMMSSYKVTFAQSARYIPVTHPISIARFFYNVNHLTDEHTEDVDEVLDPYNDKYQEAADVVSAKWVGKFYILELNDFAAAVYICQRFRAWQLVYDLNNQGLRSAVGVECAQQKAKRDKWSSELALALERSKALHFESSRAMVADLVNIGHASLQLEATHDKLLLSMRYR